ncbi:MAG: MFS transporter [Candidatus Dormibacteraceae bacterium]
MAGKVYHASVILVGVGVVPIGFLVHPISAHDIGELLFLAVATQIAALMPIRWSSGTHSVATAPLLAAGILVPGGGVALIAWMCVFDGRVPGRDLPLWQALFNRANLAITHAASSLVVLAIPIHGVWTVPVRTVGYSLAIVAINYPLTALGFSLFTRTSVGSILVNNLRLATFQAMLILGFAGGTLYVLLEHPVGYLMAPGLLGVLLAVRSNVGHAQRQAEARQQTLHLAAQALDARDRYTESHSERVAELSARIGRAMGLGTRQIEELRTAGSLHDLGKIGIPDHILNKSNSLSPDEWRVMKTHSDIGADMISQHSALAPVAPFVRHHHEKWDGSGYPLGLPGETIPLGARILTVADAFDTMTSPRLYRRSFLGQTAAVEEISSLAGRWYDPNVVDAFRSIYDLPGLASQPPNIPARRWPAGVALLLSRPRFSQLVLGMSISSLGDPLTTVATLVSIYAFTHQPLMLAVVYVLKAIATIAMGTFGGVIPDRLERKRLICVLECFRGLMLIATPLALSATLLAIFPIIFVLAAINAVVQPTRQAVIPELVAASDVGRGAATVAGSTMVTSMLGFPIAAAVLWITHTTSWLFVMDGITFVAAGVLILGIGRAGGGAASRMLGNGMRDTWRIRDARPHLVLSGIGAFFISMSFPTLLVLAYHEATNGPQAYTFLEAALAVGVICGSIVMAQARAAGSLGMAALGLALMGVLSIAIGVSQWLVLTAILLFGASVGNALYGVANQTALLQLGRSDNRGRIMSTRFAIAQTALIAGALLGGVMTAIAGPQSTYALLGAGLLTMVAGVLLRGRLARTPGRSDSVPQGPAEAGMAVSHK